MRMKSKRQIYVLVQSTHFYVQAENNIVTVAPYSKTYLKKVIIDISASVLFWSFTQFLKVSAYYMHYADSQSIFNFYDPMTVTLCSCPWGFKEYYIQLFPLQRIFSTQIQPGPVLGRADFYYSELTRYSQITYNIYTNCFH